MAPRVRSRQPMERTMDLPSRAWYPSLVLMQWTTLSWPTSSTMVSSFTSTSVLRSISTNRPAYSGPVSSSLK